MFATGILGPFFGSEVVRAIVDKNVDFDAFPSLEDKLVFPFQALLPGNTKAVFRPSTLRRADAIHGDAGPDRMVFEGSDILDRRFPHVTIKIVRHREAGHPLTFRLAAVTADLRPELSYAWTFDWSHEARSGAEVDPPPFDVTRPNVVTVTAVDVDGISATGSVELLDLLWRV